MKNFILLILLAIFTSSCGSQYGYNNRNYIISDVEEVDAEESRSQLDH